MLEIAGSVEIAAPVEVVWRVITDVDAYPDWNPFVVACRTDWAVGGPIVMKVRLGRLTVRQRETIRRHEPCEVIEYGIDLPFGSLRSSRRHRVAAVGAGTTRYDSEFALEGRLGPLVRRLLGARLRAGFDAMTDALSQRARDLERSAPGAR